MQMTIQIAPEIAEISLTYHLLYIKSLTKKIDITDLIT